MRIQSLIFIWIVDIYIRHDTRNAKSEMRNAAAGRRMYICIYNMYFKCWQPAIAISMIITQHTFINSRKGDSGRERRSVVVVAVVVVFVSRLTTCPSGCRRLAA